MLIYAWSSPWPVLGVITAVLKASVTLAIISTMNEASTTQINRMTEESFHKYSSDMHAKRNINAFDESWLCNSYVFPFINNHIKFLEKC